MLYQKTKTGLILIITTKRFRRVLCLLSAASPVLSFPEIDDTIEMSGPNPGPGPRPWTAQHRILHDSDFGASQKLVTLEPGPELPQFSVRIYLDFSNILVGGRYVIWEVGSLLSDIWSGLDWSGMTLPFEKFLDLNHLRKVFRSF